MTKENLKQALISVLVGAVVAFLTVFLEGVLEYLQGAENNIIGGIAAAVRQFATTSNQQ